MYSTCSVHEEENEGVVAAALAARGGEWELDTALPDWPRRGRAVRGLSEARAARLLRFDSRSDLCLGFFIARFVRRQEAHTCQPPSEQSCQPREQSCQSAAAFAGSAGSFPAAAPAAAAAAPAAPPASIARPSPRHFVSAVLSNLSALLRSQCPVLPEAPSDSEAEAEAGWPDLCDGCATAAALT